ncbi:hypothetical protein R3P38DRAFT_2792176 [Favolaschia claudopus]|uniref:Uncharacterized protein n=1 Tax=Favolaschia claudopus TaxID=2862362 RepID=A0AAW0AG85_9AGAR
MNRSESTTYGLEKCKYMIATIPKELEGNTTASRKPVEVQLPFVLRSISSGGVSEVRHQRVIAREHKRGVIVERGIQQESVKSMLRSRWEKEIKSSTRGRAEEDCVTPAQILDKNSSNSGVLAGSEALGITSGEREMSMVMPVGAVKSIIDSRGAVLAVATKLSSRTFVTGIGMNLGSLPAHWSGKKQRLAWYFCAESSYYS